MYYFCGEKIILKKEKNMIDIYRDSITKYEKSNKKITEDEEKKLIVLAQNGSKKALNIVVKNNLKLVIFFANKYSYRNNIKIYFDDLVQEGNLGLIKSIKKFDTTKNIKFSTYSSFWIKQKILIYIKNQPFYNCPFRLPVHVVEKIIKFKKIKNELFVKLGKEPTIQDLADYTGKDVSYVTKIFDYLYSTLSIDQDNSNDCALQEILNLKSESIIEDEKNEDVNDIIYKNQLLEIINNDFPKILSEKQIEIIKMKFGIYYGKSYTLDEIGRHFKNTKEGIRIILKFSFEKIRKNQKLSEKLKDFL